jgi:hypothetical protein
MERLPAAGTGPRAVLTLKRQEWSLHYGQTNTGAERRALRQPTGTAATITLRNEIFKAMTCSKRRRFEFNSAWNLMNNIYLCQLTFAVMGDVTWQRSYHANFIKLVEDPTTGTSAARVELPSDPAEVLG